MTTPFVGEHRREILTRLIDDFEAVRGGAGPRLVFLGAPLGWGKTRIVHEFYAHLSAVQSEAYWPAAIVSDAPLESGTEVSRRRKLLTPAKFSVPVGAVPEFIWLGVATDPSVLARPEQAYAVLAGQLEPHLYPILRRQRLTSAAGRAFFSALGTLLPIPPDFDSMLTVADGAREVFVEWWEKGEKSRVVGDDPPDASAAFWKLLTSVWKEDGKGGPPIVLVIEDAQFLTEPSVEMLGSLLTSELPLLVVATGWPLVDDHRYTPFRDLAESRSERVRNEHLESLAAEEARELIDGLHPGTDPDLVDVLVTRFAENPYALQLFLWNQGARPGMAFVYDDDLAWLAKSDDASVESELKLQLEQASSTAREAVLIASLLGYRIPIQLGDAAATAHLDGLSIIEALRTDWVRRDRADEEILAFVEPIRREAASAMANSRMSPGKRSKIIASALEFVATLLTDNLADRDRPLLETLYLELSLLTESRDENLLARCLCDLLSHAWRQRLHRLGRLLLERLDPSVARERASEALIRERLTDELRAEVAVQHAMRFRLFISAMNPRRDELTRTAVEAATVVGELRPDLLAQALGERSRFLMAKEHEAHDLEGAWEMHQRSQDALNGLDEIPDRLVHAARTRESSLVSAGGDRQSAYDLSMAEAERCASSADPNEYARLESLGAAVLLMTRIDPRRALDPSRQFIAALTEHYGTATHPRVATAQKDLAVRMLRTYDDVYLDEASELIERSLLRLTVSNGRGNTSTLNSLAARSHVHRRRARRAWLKGDLAEAARHGALALADAKELETRRGVLQQKTRPTISTRAQLALGAAWAGDEDALPQIRECVDERIRIRRESLEHTELLWLVRDLRDAYLRFGHEDAAAALADEFPAGFRDPYPS